jgi:hypothetical protein
LEQGVEVGGGGDDHQCADAEGDGQGHEGVAALGGLFDGEAGQQDVRVLPDGPADEDRRDRECGGDAGEGVAAGQQQCECGQSGDDREQDDRQARGR